MPLLFAAGMVALQAYIFFQNHGLCFFLMNTNRKAARFGFVQAGRFSIYKRIIYIQRLIRLGTGILYLWAKLALSRLQTDTEKTTF